MESWLIWFHWIKSNHITEGWIFKQRQFIQWTWLILGIWYECKGKQNLLLRIEQLMSIPILDFWWKLWFSQVAIDLNPYLQNSTNVLCHFLHFHSILGTSPVSESHTCNIMKIHGIKTSSFGLTKVFSDSLGTAFARPNAAGVFDCTKE